MSASSGGPRSTATAGEVRATVQRYHDSIFASYHTLQQILPRHEPRINKRWSQWGKQKRLKVLLAAWPDMAASHRPDFKEYCQIKFNGHRPRDTSNYRSIFMWPYINQEDLSKPTLFPLLLNSRGRNQPWAFAAADSDAMSVGMSTGVISRPCLDQYTMILNSVSTASEYGQILHWDDHPGARDWYCWGKEFTVSQGLLVLEAQDKVLSFLVKCCQLILHEIAPLDLIKGPIHPEPEIARHRDTTGFESLVAMAEDAPYRLPATLDFDLIESLLAARVDAAEDHWWSMREDPSYLAERLSDYNEHSIESLTKCGYGQPCADSEPTRNTAAWTLAVRLILVDAIMDLEVFTSLLQQTQNLKRLQEKYSHDILPSKDLPQEYIDALLTFRFTLEQSILGPTDALKDAFLASPPVRKFHTFASTDKSDQYSVAQKPNVHWKPAEAELRWLLSIMWETQVDNIYVPGKISFDFPFLVDELERLLRAEPKARALLSTRVGSIVEDISIISQVMAQLCLYKPWANTFDFLTDKNMDQLQVKWDALRDLVRSAWTVIKDDRLENMVRGLEPILDGRLNYPLDKKRTKDNVAALRSAESILDGFWTKMDSMIFQRFTDLKKSAMGRLEERTLQRTPAWSDPLPAVNKSKKKTSSQDPDLASLGQPFSGLGLQDDTPRSFTPQLIRVKVKTKGTPAVPGNPDPTTTDGGVTASTQNPTQARIEVDARSLKTFRQLFHVPNVQNAPGEIPWKDFLHAMTSTGFNAIKLHGSAWHFSPMDVIFGVTHSIIFDEPHPSSKMSVWIARRNGRRLHRSFGWTGETFKLKEKKDAEDGAQKEA